MAKPTRPLKFRTMDEIACVRTTGGVAGAMLAPGMHLNVMGAHDPHEREIDTAAVRRARVFVDAREQAFAEKGELLVPIAEGAIDASHIVAQIGTVLEGRAGGRGSDDEITLFKSLGLAVEDVAAACHVARAADEDDAGTVVEM